MIWEISPKFPYHKKRSAMDAHSRDRNILHKCKRARRENVAHDILLSPVTHFTGISVTESSVVRNRYSSTSFAVEEK